MKSRLLLLLLLLTARLGAHPLTFNSTITYSAVQPSGAAGSVAQWSGAAFDAANIGGSGVNADGGANNGTANDASTRVTNQTTQGQTFTTGSNANGYEVSGITVRLVGYTNNTATGANQPSWNLGPVNWPTTVTVGKVNGTTHSLLSIQNFMAGSEGNPGVGSSANGPGTYLTFNLPFPVHLDPNTTYGFDLATGNSFEWLGTRSDPYAGGTAYSRSGSTITPLSGDRVFQVNMTASAAPYAPFSHPGALHTQADFDRMKAKIAASAAPWKTSYDHLTGSRYMAGWGPTPYQYINRGGTAANNYTRTQWDAQAIYQLSLRWKLTGDDTYANRAVVIANAWSNKLLGITGDSNQSLAAGICGYLFAIGGEMLSAYPGWPAAEKQAYKDVMMRVFYPANLDFLWRHHGTPVNSGGNTHYRLNWDTDNMASMAAIGILCDNRAVYQQAVDYFKFGSGNGRVERAAWYIHPDGTAQTEESGRDQPHNQGGWYSMGLLCQMAWNQGDDLFGYDNNRVLRAYEYSAKFNSGNDVSWVYHRNTDITYTETLSSSGRSVWTYPAWELIYNHYANVKGIAAPWSKIAMNMVRPEGFPQPSSTPSAQDSLGLGSLTYARDDTTTSAAPSGLLAQWSKNQLILNWWGSATATSYQIQRTASGASAAGPYTTLGTATEPNLNFTDTTVAQGGSYYYKIVALTPAGNLESAPLLVNQALVASYTFEGNTNDGTGTRHATAKGGATAPGYAAGFGGGQAISLNGTDQYVQLPVNSALSRDVTLSTWVYWNGGNNWQRVFDFGSEIETYMMLTVKDSTGKMRFQMTTSRATDGTITLVGPVMPTATWTQLAVTFNGETATLYMNGLPVAAGSSPRLSPMFSQPFCYLGRSMWNPDAYFSGRIDNFRIYNYALSGSDVYALWGQSANAAPVFVGDPITRPAAAEDAAYTGQTLAGAASDANGGALTFSKVTGPAWLSVASNGALSGTPANGDVGTNLFVVRVTDSSGATDDANLYITVGNTNDAPAWPANPLTKPQVTRDQPYVGATLAGDASDVDAGDTLTFSKVSGPAWLAVAANGTLSGTPGASDVGANVFTVRVTDSTGAFANTTLNITVLGFGLRTHLLFENNTNDALGNANGTVTGSPAYIAGRTAQSIVLDGVDDVVTLPAGAADYQDITVATWVYWNGGANYQRIFDFGNGTTQFLSLTPNTPSGMRFEIANGGTYQQTFAPALATGRWVHVAVTLSGNTGTLYVNGAVAGTNTNMTIDPDDFRAAVNYIGDSQYSGDPLFAGQLDDFRIYNYALSAAEITALLDISPAPPSSLAAGPKSNRIDLIWLASQGAQTYSVKRSTTSGGSYAAVASGLTAANFSDTGLTNGTPYFYIVTATNTHGESNPSPEISVVPIDLLVHLKFDETSGPTATDSSSNGWNGTVDGAASFVAGRIGNAVSLSGANADRVTFANGVVAPLNDFTITAWVKPNTLATWARVFDFGTGTATYMFLTTSNGSVPRFAFRLNNGTEQGINGTAALTAGVWTHLAVTLSGDIGTLYVNGVAVGTNNAMTLKPSSLGTTTQNWLGDSEFSTDPSLDALIDDFRIYTRALSAPEITAFQTTLTVPQNLAATPAPLSIALAWNAMAMATSYTVKTATTSGGSFTTLASGITATSYTHTELPWGTTRYYIVSATNITGESPDSAEASASPASPLITAEEIRPPTFACVPANGENDAAWSFTSAASVIGHTYLLQTTDNLATGTWTDISDPVPGTRSVIGFVAPFNSTEPRRFYRILISR